MNLVNNDQSNKVGVTSIGRFTRDDIPFLWCRNDDLSLRDLLLGQLRVTSQLADLDT